MEAGEWLGWVPFQDVTGPHVHDEHARPPHAPVAPAQDEPLRALVDARPARVCAHGAPGPPAALGSLSSLVFELDVEPLLDWSLSFFCLRSPLCLPLFWCSRPCASVVTFGLSVGPAFGVSDVLAPAPAFAPIEALPLAVLLSLMLPLVLAPAPTLALPLALVSPCTLVLWAAASWLNDTASKPEKRTGKNLRIEDPPGVGKWATGNRVAKAVPRLLRRLDRLVARQFLRARRRFVPMRTGVGVDRPTLFLGHRRRATCGAVRADTLLQLLLLLRRQLRLRGRLALALRERGGQ